MLIAHHDGEPLTMLKNTRATDETITMNYRQKVQRLTRLQDMDPDLLLKEIDQPWPGMEADMEVALAIMRTCQENGERMSLLESFHIDDTAGEFIWLMILAGEQPFSAWSHLMLSCHFEISRLVRHGGLA